MLEHWKTLESQDLYVAEPWLRLSRDRVQLPDGRIIEDYHQVHMQDYVVLLVQVPDGRLLLVRQYRQGIGAVSLMLPGGAIEPGEDPLTAAQRELLEETGYVAENWRSLCQFVSSPNYGCGRGHIYMAQNAQQVTAPNSGDLEEMELVWLEPEAALATIRSGDVVALSAIAAISLAILTPG